MRSLQLIGVATCLALGTACGGLSTSYGTTGGTLATPGTTTDDGTGGGGGGGGGGGTGTGTTTGSGTGGTTTGSATGSTSTGTPGPGNFTGVNATNALTSCSLTANELDGLAATWAGFNWAFSIGGPIDPYLLSLLGTQAPTPANEYWGSTMTADIFTDPQEGFSWAWETSGITVLLDPAGDPYPMPDHVALTYGLADGYFVVTYPWYYGIDPSFTNNLIPWAGNMTINLYLGVQNNTLTDIDIDGTVVNSALEINIGTATWYGDLNDTANYCSVWLDLNGRPISSN